MVTAVQLSASTRHRSSQTQKGTVLKYCHCFHLSSPMAKSTSNPSRLCGHCTGKNPDLRTRSKLQIWPWDEEDIYLDIDEAGSSR